MNYDNSKVTSYHGGSKVRVNNKIYECMQGSSSAWCGMMAYKPGEATQYWKLAWKEITNSGTQDDDDSKDDSNDNGENSNDDGEKSNTIQNYDETKISSYKAGTKIRVNKKIYQCKNGPASGWCSLAIYKPGEATGFWKAAWDEIAESQEEKTDDQDGSKKDQGDENDKQDDEDKNEKQQDKNDGKDQSNKQDENDKEDSNDDSEGNDNDENDQENDKQQEQKDSSDGSQGKSIDLNFISGTQSFDKSKVSSYKAGTKVKVGNKIYQCKNGPASGWCSLAIYKPGEATGFWKAAWNEVSQESEDDSDQSDQDEKEDSSQDEKEDDSQDEKEDNSQDEKEDNSQDGKNDQQQDNKQQDDDDQKQQTEDDQKQEHKSAEKFYSLYPSEESTDFSKLKKIGDDVYLEEQTKKVYLSGKIKRLVDAATAFPGEPSIDFKNPENNPQNVRRVMGIISQSDWNYLFAVANKIYSYTDFLKAVAKFRHFCGEKGPYTNLTLEQVCKKELATVFSHANQETGAHTNPAYMKGVDQWRQGLYFVRQVACVNGGCGYRGGCQGWAGKAWPCPAGVEYYGRGMKQLSYNYNYGPFSEVMFGDVNVLLGDPDRVARQGWLAVASAFWFYMKPQSPKPSMHDVVAGFWKPSASDEQNGIHKGFGTTINIINGGLECNKQSAQADNRVKYYKEFLKYFKLQNPADQVLDCRQSKGFQSNGSAALATYWEQNWSKSGECKLVTYQRPYSVYGGPNDYLKCVKLYFPNSA